MRLSYTDEQQDLRDTYRSVFSQGVTPASIREAASGFDPILWERFEADGTTAIATPDGGDAQVADLVQIVLEAGRSLAPVPIAEHFAATRVLAQLDESLVGPGVVAFAPAVAADGVAHAVPAGAVASRAVVYDGDALVLVESPRADAPANLALSPLADIAVEGTTLLRGDDARRTFDQGVVLWRTLLAALLTGAAEGALESGVAYAMQRMQFGVPIGSFQAVQQQLADLPGRIDGSALLVGKAAWAIDTAPDAVIDIAHNDITDPEALATMAYLFAAETAKESTARNVQVHGGYGYSEEYDAQLYYRKVRGWAVLGGTPPATRLELARTLGLAG